MGMTATISHCERDARLKIEVVPEAAAEARTFVEETLTRWALRPLIEDAKLIVSELIGNSVMVTPGAEIWALLSQERDALWICVWDSCPILPEVRACDPYAESGRGMRIVAALADENGAFRVARPQGKIT
jgi:anti-sigma regulatory factor (Ser/Thr protein kinase)